MRVFIVLFALVCAIQAAKYKYFLEDLTEGENFEVPFLDTVWVLHDKDVSVLTIGDLPSKALEAFILNGDLARFLNEVRSLKGVYDAGILEGLAPGESHSFFVQGDDPVARFTLVIPAPEIEDGYFFTNLGSRLPSDVVTDFTGDFELLSLTAAGIEEVVDTLDVDYPTGPEAVRLIGRQICPDNDQTVYVQFDSVSNLQLSAPVFWTQAGGSNAVFWPGVETFSTLQDLVEQGDAAAFADETVQNEDVCYTWASLVNVDGEDSQIWAIPVATGHKLFFATSVMNDTWSGVDDVFPVLIAPQNNGISLFRDQELPEAWDITNEVELWKLDTSVNIWHSDDIAVHDLIYAFVYDHYPTGEEFPEEEEKLIDGYEIGICGSYALGEDGIYHPQEWQNHPYDCTDQLGGDKCMFCKGRANDIIRSVCLERLGSGCNAAFNAPPSAVFCNLEFECPASTISFSLFFVLLSLLGIFFGF